MALAYAILASLISSPCSGYDLAKQFNGSVSFYWKATSQQIYHELAKLEAKGWVSSEKIPQKGLPNKKLYCVTELGQKQLVEWLASPCEPSPIKDELLVKIPVGYLVPRQIILEELEHHRKVHLQKLSVYQDLEQQYLQNPQELPQDAKFRYLTLLRGIYYETDWLTWCDKAIQLLK